MYCKQAIFLFLFFVQLYGATNNLISFSSKFNISPFITVNDRHIKSFKILYDPQRSAPYLVGLHHDYQNKYQNRGLVQLSHVIQGPMDSFAGRVTIAGIDYGFKTLFSSEWSYDTIVAFLVMLCVERYGNMTFEEYSRCMKREIFEGLIEKKLLVRIVFDKQKYQVVSAYPLI